MTLNSANRTSQRRSRPAFTLVEVMLAVLLGGFVATSAAVIAVQCVKTREVVADEIVARWERVLVRKQFEDDIHSALIDKKTQERLLGPSKLQDVLVEATTIIDAPLSQSPFPTRLPAKVSYRVEASSIDRGAKRLVREYELLTERQPMSVRRILAEELTGVAVSFFRDGQWISDALPDSGPPAFEAVRLKIAWMNERRPQDVTVFLGAPGWGKQR